LTAKGIIVGKTVDGSLTLTDSLESPKIVMSVSGGEGLITSDDLTLNDTLTAPNVIVSTDLQSQGTSTFTGSVTLNGALTVNGGINLKVTGGAGPTDGVSVNGLAGSPKQYTVTNPDALVKLDFDAAALELLLVPSSPEVAAGHLLTLVNVSTATDGTMNAANIQGAASIAFDGQGSSITLISLGSNTWMIQSSYGMTIS
jgi:hypothetical protein